MKWRMSIKHIAFCCRLFVVLVVCVKCSFFNFVRIKLRTQFVNDLFVVQTASSSKFSDSRRAVNTCQSYSLVAKIFLLTRLDLSKRAMTIGIVISLSWGNVDLRRRFIVVEFSCHAYTVFSVKIYSQFILKSSSATHYHSINMATLIKFRPFAAQCRRYSPNILSALTNDSTWWYDEPLWTKSSSRNSLDSGNNFGELIDNDKVWKLSYDLPGIKAKDLSVTIDGSNVQISASRNLTSLSGDSKTIKKARIFKSFPVTSNNVDLSQLKANLSDGVLVISAPKKESSDMKEIAITTEPHSEEPGLLDGEELEQLAIDEASLEEELESITIRDSAKSASDSSKK